MGRKKKQSEDDVNPERWLVSYADFITLLFAFFTTLYAISTVDAQKMGKMVMSLRASFDNTVFAPGSRTLSLSKAAGGIGSNHMSLDVLQKISTPRAATRMNEFSSQRVEKLMASSSQGKQRVSGEKAMGRLKRNVESLLGSAVLKDRVEARVEPRGLVISLGERGFFPSGSDQIEPEGRALLDTIATGLVSLDNYIRIEGHTDNVPICKPKFPSNWELSTARATEILSYLIVKFGFTPDHLSAAGYSEYRPVAPNETEQGRARNRRVDIVVLNPVAAQIEPK